MSNYTFPSIIFISSLVLCLIPKFLTKIKTIKQIYPYITTFSAGFMLSVMLVDFIPHLISHEHKTIMCPLHSHNEYYSCKKNHTPDEEKELRKIEEKNKILLNSDNKEVNKDLSGNNDTAKKKAHCSHNHGHFNYGLFTAGLAFILLITIDSLVLNHSHCDNKHAIDDHTQHSHDSFGTCNTKVLKYTTSMTQAIILILALSVHSFFEGLAFSKQNAAITFEIGILFHKVLESFTLGVTMASSKFDFKSNLILSAAYSILTPLGMVIGYNLGIDGIVKQVFNGLALGSTMFIVCIEMIPPMFHSKGDRIENVIKIGCLTAGFLMTSAIIKAVH